MRRSVLLLAVLFGLVWGCGGGSGSGGDADPAKVLPARTTLYLEATVRPDGEQGDNASALLGKVLRTDDGPAKLQQLFDDAISEDTNGATYERDVAPWLGQRIGLAVVMRSGAEPGYIAAIATKDADKAADFVAKQSQTDNAKKRTIAGVDAYLDEDTYTGVAGDYVIVSDTAADFRKAVKAEEDGGGLTTVDRFTSARDDLPEERLGALWLDPSRFAELAAAGTGGDAVANSILKSAFGGLKPITAVLTAGKDTATIETRAGGAFATASASEILKSLPGDAWAALGSADVGKGFEQALAKFGGGIGSAVVAQQVQQATGLSLRDDILSWIGDVAVYVKGESMADIRGAVVIEATDADKAAAAIPRLIGAARQQLGAPFSPVALTGADQAFSAPLPDGPGPVVVARADDRVVLALGEATAKAALSPDSTLGDSGLYDRAADALDGFAPSLIAAAAPALELIEDSAAGDPDFAKAKPYLETLDLAAAGSKRDGDAVRTRFALKVK
jgi:Protein of unknown function (DUF3352)